MIKTPEYRIRSALRRLFLYSPERYQAVKRDKNTCQRCGVKGSKAKGAEVKIEVHHKQGIGNWNKVIKQIREELLCDPDLLECLCKNCHKRVTLDEEGDAIMEKLKIDENA